MTRKEIIDICQISRTMWMNYEANGLLPFPNAEEYSCSEALELIKFFRYCKKPAKTHSDMSKNQLAVFLGIKEDALQRHLKQGTIPQPTKQIGKRLFYTHEEANRIKAKFQKGTTPWDRAKQQGLYSISEVCRMWNMKMRKFWRFIQEGRINKPTRPFENRFFYSKRDVRDMRRKLFPKSSEEQDSQE